MSVGLVPSGIEDKGPVGPILSSRSRLIPRGLGPLSLSGRKGHRTHTEVITVGSSGRTLLTFRPNDIDRSASLHLVVNDEWRR